MTHSYPYRFNRKMAVFCILFFGACAAFFTYQCVTNDVGLILNGIIELGPTSANWFYGILGFLSWGFVAIGVAGLLMPKRQLTLTENDIIVPTGFFGRNQRQVAWYNVRGIKEMEVSGTRTLTLNLIDGKVSITNRMLPTKESYDEVRAHIVAAVEKHVQAEIKDLT